MANLHISISAEPIFNLGPLTVTNSMLVGVLVTAILSIIAIAAYPKIKDTDKPKGIQNLLESIINSLLGLVAGTVGERKARLIFPYIATFFLFIILSNWFGLLPGVGTIGILEQPEEAHIEETHPEETAMHEPEKADMHIEEDSAHAPATTSATTEDSHTEEESGHAEGPKFVPLLRGATADINTTLALAIVSVGLTQYVGFKSLGFSYIKKFINFSDPIQFFIGILELVAELAKIMSFAFRLFGNIFAGEVLLGVIAFLVPIAAPLPFLGLEIFVGFIQALVFSMLTLVFMNLATISHSEH